MLASSLKETITTLPTGVLYAIPYALIAILLLVVALYIVRGEQELKDDVHLRQDVEFSTTLATEKNKFLKLVLPYLSTPLNIFANGVALTEKSLSVEQHRQYVQNVELLRVTVEHLVTHIESTKKVQAISSEPIWQVQLKTVVKSKRFLLPVAGLIFILLVFYSAATMLTNHRPSSVNLVIQIAAFIVISLLLYVAVRNTMNLKGENSRLRALNTFIRGLDSRRTSILQNAQHALQTPIINLQEIATHIPDTEAREYVARGLQQSNKLLRSFDFVLRLEANIIDQKRPSSSMQEVVGQAVQAVLSKVQAKQLSLDVEGLDLRSPVSIETDLMELVLRALLLNSIEASPAKSVINLKSQSIDGHLKLQVIDNGVGISRLELDSLFQFYPNLHMHTTNPTAPNGPGLSLIISQMIIHAFHGELSIESVQGKGTIATISLPLN